MTDLFLFITKLNIANYVNDRTLNKFEVNLIEAQTKIEAEPLKVYEWFRNSTKSYVMLTADNILKSC